MLTLQKKQIDDFYDFFTRPWMSALYQETFTDLVDDINHQDIGTVLHLTFFNITLIPSYLKKS